MDMNLIFCSPQKRCRTVQIRIALEFHAAAVLEVTSVVRRDPTIMTAQYQNHARIGFESGGLALAHPLALAFTQIDAIHHKYLHGEMVAMGTAIQLALERSDDAEKVARFFAQIGLPIHLSLIHI